MYTKQIEIGRVHNKKFVCNIIVIAFLSILIEFMSVAQAAFNIPTDRSVTWQGYVGVKGDIPKRTVICKILSPSGGDDHSSIQTAINNCPSGQVVKLNPGTFQIGNFISMKSNITLRGSGIGVTTLQGASAANTSKTLIDFVGSGYSWNLSNQTAYNITGGLTKGSISITTSSPHNWNVGDIIVIDQLESGSVDPPVDGGTQGCTYCGRPFSGTVRSEGQINKVTAVPTSTTAALEIPLYISYDRNRTPQGIKVGGVISNSGVEDLTVDNSISGNINQANYGTIAMESTDNAWLLRLEVIGSWQQMVRLNASYRNTIRSCKFHEGIPATPTVGTQYGSKRAYGLLLAPWASGNLIEDNIFYHLSAGPILTSVSSGNVIAYNYVTSLYYIDNKTEREAISFHGMYPMMNLVEGNHTEGMLISDYYHGGSGYNTFFRNRAYSPLDKTNLIWGVALFKHAWYYNIVGNVLGINEFESTYEVTDISSPYGSKNIYTLGFPDASGSCASGCDSQVKATLLRHGNWDSVTHDTVWDPNFSERNLPMSLYLFLKPSWYGGCQWPPIDPSGPTVYDIPAKLRYEGASCTDVIEPNSPTLKPLQ